MAFEFSTVSNSTIEIWLFERNIDIARKFKEVNYIICINLWSDYFSTNCSSSSFDILYFIESIKDPFSIIRVNHRIKRSDAVECFLAKLLGRVTLQKSNFLMSRIRAATRMQNSANKSVWQEVFFILYTNSKRSTIMVDNVRENFPNVPNILWYFSSPMLTRIKNKCKGNTENSRTFCFLSVNNFKLYFTVSLKSLSIFYLAKI